MAIDPNIKQKAENIRLKKKGREVRESLAAGLEAMSEDVVSTVARQGNVEEQFQEVIDNTTGKDVISAPELIAARNGEANLKDRLDKEQQDVNAQLAQTMTQTEFDSWVAAILDGGPSIFVDTLAALENIYPEGSEGVALVRETDPAHIYVWNKVEGYWQDFGAYQGIEIKEDSQDLKILKNSYLYRPNLVDTENDDYLVGKGFSGTTGDIVNSPSNVITNYVELNPGEKLVFKINGLDWYNPQSLNYANNKIVTYDSNGNWVKTQMGKDLLNYIPTEKVYVRVMSVISADEIVVNTSGQKALLSRDMIEPAKEEVEIEKKKVDIVLLSGQSNAAGRGIKRPGMELTNDKFPEVPMGWAYDFRAISDPTKLYALSEPFGYYENNSNTEAINDSSNKTGSMMSSFAVDYYKITKTPLVCVSASQGSTGIDVWQPGTPKLNDAINRLSIAKNWLLTNDYEIGRVFMVWCQGEADYQMDVEEYKSKFNLMVSEMVANGVGKCFNVRIGEHNSGDGTNYDSIIQAQTELCRVNTNVVLVGTKFAEMRTQGLMKDTSHYYQEGYNIQGSQAGINVANYINTLKEPLIYDTKYSELYYSYKL